MLFTNVVALCFIRNLSQDVIIIIVTSQQEPVFFCRINENPSLTAKSKGKKRKIAETSNVITETLPSVEGEQVSMFMLVTLRYSSLKLQ